MSCWVGWAGSGRMTGRLFHAPPSATLTKGDYTFPLILKIIAKGIVVSPGWCDINKSVCVFPKACDHWHVSWNWGRYIFKFAFWCNRSKSKSKCLLAQQCGTCLTNIHNYNRNAHTKKPAKWEKNCTIVIEIVDASTWCSFPVCRWKVVFSDIQPVRISEYKTSRIY